MRDLIQSTLARLTPPPDLTVSEWADAYRRLSSEASAEPGRWRTDRAPYQRDILNAINDPACEQVVVMSSAQVGKTEILLNIIGYFVDYDPSPILLLQPTLEMAQAFSKDRLAPMLRDTPSLTGKVADVKARSSGNTMLHKVFPGGHITMSGANSPASLASRPIRIVLADEIDRYPVSAGTEGDPVNLAKKRTTTFWNRKIVLVSTPTVKGASRIERAYEDSTQERYCLPCPSCGEYQQILRRHIEHYKEQDTLTAVQASCEHCGAIHSEPDWKRQTGKWIAGESHLKCRGFHLNEYMSPWRTWLDIERDFLEAKKSPETLKTFVNTSLGETWEEEGERLESNQFYTRREHYTQLPERACVLTAAVDVQDDRLEIGVEAWGVGEENWKIDFRILRGNPAQPAIWKELDEALQRTYTHTSGVQLSITCTTIDSGGHHTQQVYKFCKSRELRRIYAIKGRAGEGAPVVARPTTSNMGKVKLFTVGVDTAKESIYSRLQVNEPGPGYIHFPVHELFDSEYFEQLTAEQRVTKFFRGFPKRVWEKRRSRNEALDIAVYNLAALYILNPNLKILTEKLKPAPEDPQQQQPQAKPAEIRPQKRPTRQERGFVNSWR